MIMEKVPFKSWTFIDLHDHFQLGMVRLTDRNTHIDKWDQ